MLNKIGLALSCGTLAFVVSSCVNAGKLSLADSPLVVAETVVPNIMILFDTSGSMQELIMEEPYDSSIDYSAACKSGHWLSDSKLYYLDVDATGKARFREYVWWGNDSEYYWGVSGDVEYFKCFRGNRNYNVKPVVIGGDISEQYLSYPGNYLNWYFSNEDQTGPADFGVGAGRRPGTQMRVEVGRAAIASLIGAAGDEDRLQKARVGLAGFDSSDGEADFVSKLADVDDERTALLASIDNLGANGGTPLTSSLASVGRYFVDGHTAERLDSDQDGDRGEPDGDGVEHDLTAGELFDNEPDYNDLASPVAGEVMQYSCQKNFIVALTDGEPTSDDNYHDTLAKWEDGEVNHSSGGTGDFDDVAQALYDLDLRPETYPNDTNNVSTYTIAFALDLPMLDRASGNAGGDHYDAANASQLTNALNAIANKVKAQVSTVASVAFNSGRLVSGSSVFQAKFNTDGYSGQLLSFELSGDGSISEDPSWDAGKKLAAMTPASRKIFTYNDMDNEGVAFTWDNLSADQKNDLGHSAIPDDLDDGDQLAAFALEGQKVLDFTRGDNSSSDFRGRDASDQLAYQNNKFLLGDIVNSTPVFVGTPELNWPDNDADARFGSSATGGSYSEYKSGAAADRSPVVYVGANDGMLHGFDAANDGGDEVFAYIPGAVYSTDNDAGLHYLADPGYTHRFYVDATPAVSDVFIPNTPDMDRDDNTSPPSAWRTVMIGGLRGGGRGLFALDVSDPSKFVQPAANAADIVLWEFTSADDADLGYTYGQPSIVMMPNGRWAAVVGNGYNSDAENAHLFVLFLDGGLDGVWTEGTDYIKIQAGADTSNGLSTPRVVDLDGDQVADRAYAGDLQGNLWVFDLSDDDDPANWKIAYSGGGNDKPLFSGDNGTEVQPITSAPVLAKNSVVAADDDNVPNVLVFFGTGKFLEPADSDSNLELQSYYGVWDSGEHSLNRDDLLERQIVTEIKSVDDPNSGDVADTIDIALRKVESADVAIGWGTQYGWYMDLENKASADGSAQNQGERVVTESLLRRQVLFFNSIIPDSIPCSGGGSGWLMSLDYLTGLAPPFATFDANRDGKIDDADLTYVGQQFLEGLPSKSGVLGDRQYTPGSKGTIEDREIEVGKGAKEGRLSWEELLRN